MGTSTGSTRCRSAAVNAVKKSKGVKVNEWPGGEITNITWNSNQRKLKNRELLDPRVKKALSMCVDRDKMIQVVFSGYATKVESLVGHISPFENPNLGPTSTTAAAANKALDKLGYKRGSNGIRIAPATTGKYAQGAHPMKYEIIIPTSLDFNGQRMFEIVKEGFAKLGVTATLKVGGDATASYALETDAKCDAAKSIGYSKFDIAMWDWIAGPEPDFQLSVVTKAQWCSWSDTGWDNPAYDRLYEQQGVTADAAKRQGDHLQDAEDGLRRVRVHAAHEPRRARRHLDEVDRVQEPSERVLEDVLHEPEEGLSLADETDRGQHF